MQPSLASAPSVSTDTPPPDALRLTGATAPGFETILTPEALAFVEELVLVFGPRRDTLLDARRAARARYRRGELPAFGAETRAIREGDWTVGPLAADLLDRRVEITGPVDRKMIINALNSGANVFMADFEDSSAPTWVGQIQGQINLRDAVRREIDFTHPETGKRYALGAQTATLMVRPRGWHLPEAHVLVAGRPAPAALVDFGLYFFHNAAELIARGSGPYFYLPKLEGWREAELWNDVFVHAQARLDIPRGTIKATVLIETLPGAFAMDEILYALRDHSAGLNCGRWDYIFSVIKTLGHSPDFVLPDRSQIGMTQPLMRAYSQHVIRTCHRRGVHAMGGMAAQIPIKHDAEANERALGRVRVDKEREVADGHDGTWVAHPGLVGLARAIFDVAMPGANQIDRALDPIEEAALAAELVRLPGGTRTEAGLRQNVNVGLLYLEAWLGGTGCVPLYDLMEDAATAEISRTQLWQWVHHGAALDDGRVVTSELFRRVLSEELDDIAQSLGTERFNGGHFAAARDLFTALVLDPELADFLTLPAYRLLVAATSHPTPTGAAMTPQTTPATPNSETTVSLDPHAASYPYTGPRWAGIVRNYSYQDVLKLRGSVRIEQTLATLGATRLWELMEEGPYVSALGALTGNQAVQQVRAGLKSIYLSGWQVAADANLSGHMYPDQSLYPVNSVPSVVQRINQALQRADQIEHAEGEVTRHWFAPIMADAEAGFGGPLNAYELMKQMIEAGAAGVHFEDQLSSEKKCGHLGGKVLVPTAQFVRTLTSARLAADVMGVPTVLVARTDANSARLITNDIDSRDEPFITSRERTPEGFFRITGGLDMAIARGLAYAPYADLIWCETGKPDIEEARRFAEAIHAQFPGKKLAYNCSPSFNWKRNLDDATIATFQSELGAMGYAFQFVTLAGFHALNLSMYELAAAYAVEGMTAYSRMQEREFATEGFTAVRHQREVGTGYFDEVSRVISAGKASTLAMGESTESEQFQDEH